MKKPTAAVIVLAVTALALGAWALTKPDIQPQPPRPAAQGVDLLFDVSDSYQPYLLDAITAAKKLVRSLPPGIEVTISTIGADASTSFIELRHSIPVKGPTKLADDTKTDKSRIYAELDAIHKQPMPHLTDILAKLNDATLPRGPNVTIYLFTDARQCDRDGCLEGLTFKPYAMRPIRSLQQSHVYFVGVAREGLSGKDADRLASFWGTFINTHGGSIDGFTESMEAACREYTR
jgi:hypothetical protein